MKDEDFLKNEVNLRGQKIIDFVNVGSIQWKLLVNAMNCFAKHEVLKAINGYKNDESIAKGKSYAIGFAGGLACAFIVYLLT